MAHATGALPYQNKGEAFPGSLQTFLKPEESWLAFVLMALIMLAPVHVVEGAKWVKEMPGLTGMALFSLFTGYVLAKIRVPAILLHPLALVVGALVISWQIVNVASGTTVTEQITDAVVRLYAFYHVVLSGTISTDGLPFALQVIALTWLLGYLSAWFLFRMHSALLAILPVGAALMVNLTYLPGRFTESYLVFTIASLLLVMLMHGAEQMRRWKLNNVPNDELMHLSYVGPVLTFGAAILIFSFWMPLLQQSASAMSFWERVTVPWRGFESQFDRLFASVSSGTSAPLHTFGGSLAFRGTVNFGDNSSIANRLGLVRDEVMYVAADEAGYWRAESYDTYTSQGWLTSGRSQNPLPQDPVLRAFDGFKARKPFTQAIEVVAPLNVIFARGLPIFGNAPITGETPLPARYTLYLNDLTQNRGLAPELQTSAERMRDTFRRSGQLASRSDMQRLLPNDLRVENTTLRGTSIESIDIVRTQPFPPDIKRMLPAAPLQRGQKYAITSSVSTASPEDLRSSNTDIPGWVRDQYLQLPLGMSPRIPLLAKEWTVDVVGAYDKALAIEAKLRAEYAYVTNIPAPPRNSDAVEYFLFDLKRGYSDYHASAMTLLLRAMGVPARLSVGYLPGDWDAEAQHYVVREAHAHSWVEVYFPEYGWVDFNPTPNSPLPLRGIDPNNPSSSSNVEEDFPEDTLPNADDDMMQSSSGLESTDTNSLAAYVEQIGKGMLVLLGFLALVWLVMRFIWLYGLSGLSLPVQTYEKMSRLAALAQLRPAPGQTPLEFGNRLSGALPEAQGSIHDISQGYAKSVYSNKEETHQDAENVRNAWKDLRWKLVLKVLHWRKKGGGS